MCTHLSVEEPIYPPVTREVQRGEIRVMQYAPDSFGFVEVDFNPHGQMRSEFESSTDNHGTAWFCPRCDWQMLAPVSAPPETIDRELDAHFWRHASSEKREAEAA